MSSDDCIYIQSSMCNSWGRPGMEERGMGTVYNILRLATSGGPSKFIAKLYTSATNAN